VRSIFRYSYVTFPDAVGGHGQTFEDPDHRWGAHFADAFLPRRHEARWPAGCLPKDLRRHTVQGYENNSISGRGQQCCGFPSASSTLYALYRRRVCSTTRVERCPLDPEDHERGDDLPSAKPGQQPWLPNLATLLAIIIVGIIIPHAGQNPTLSFKVGPECEVSR
jgi:hypothetical protein